MIPSNGCIPVGRTPLTSIDPPWAADHLGAKPLDLWGCGRSPGTILALRVGPSLVVPEVDFFGGRGSKLVDNSKSFQIVESIFACI